MDRLTETAKYPLDNFQRCQLCGFTSNDICEFRLLMECDDNDKPEQDKVIVRCRQEACIKVVDDHPRLYMEVPWGQGHPGIFMLLCGDCPNRKGTTCTHSDLKANGGQGLEVRLSNNPNIIVCFNDGKGCRNLWPNPATRCKGHPTKNL